MYTASKEKMFASNWRRSPIWRNTQQRTHHANFMAQNNKSRRIKSWLLALWLVVLILDSPRGIFENCLHFLIQLTLDFQESFGMVQRFRILWQRFHFWDVDDNLFVMLRELVLDFCWLAVSRQLNQPTWCHRLEIFQVRIFVRSLSPMYCSDVLSGGRPF